VKASALVRCAIVPALFAIAGALAVPGVAAAATWRMALGNADSRSAVISTDGAWVAFDSEASDLVSDDTNASSDVFVADRATGDLELVSVSSGGELGNALSEEAGLSGDGRYVVFRSNASNLVAGDTNDTGDIFLHDRLTGTTVRVSVSSSGGQANGASSGAYISADGRYVAFYSEATNLVSGDTNHKNDIFVHDMLTGTTKRVSVRASSTQANSDSFLPVLSANGRYVAFFSYASNLVSGDTNKRADVFVRDLTTKVTSRVSVTSSERQYAKSDSRYASISADGRYVAFQSGPTGTTDGQTDIYVRDRKAGTTKRISGDSFGHKANGWSFSPSISANGRYVAYMSLATNLVPADTNDVGDIFTFDRSTGVVTRVSVDSAAAQVDGDGRTGTPSAISGDGRYVAFQATWDWVDEWNRIDGVFVCDTAGLPAQHLVSSPIAPSVMKHAKSYTVFGYLKPRHMTGSISVLIYLDRKNSSGTWVPKGYVTARVSDYSSYSKYATSVKLPTTGKWRLRAYAPADAEHAEMWSIGYDHVTVK